MPLGALKLCISEIDPQVTSYGPWTVSSQQIGSYISNSNEKDVIFPYQVGFNGFDLYQGFHAAAVVQYFRVPPKCVPATQFT